MPRVTLRAVSGVFCRTKKRGAGPAGSKSLFPGELGSFSEPFPKMALLIFSGLGNPLQGITRVISTRLNYGNLTTRPVPDPTRNRFVFVYEVTRSLEEVVIIV